MHRRSRLVESVIAAVLGVMLLSGCSSSMVGKSTFGNNRIEVAELTNLGDYTPERAMSEARAHFRNKDFGYSAALYKRAVELSPKDPEGYIGLAASYDRLQRFDLSDRVYAALYDLSGASVQYHNNRGYSYLLRGDLRAAMSSFREARKIDPDNVVVANNIRIVEDAAAAARA
jgi:Flp pilus assembly protein TadD